MAFGVLAVAVAPLFVMQSTSVEQARASLPRVFASALAGELADQLRTLPFGMLPTQKAFVFAYPSPEVRLPGDPSVPLAVGKYPFTAQVSIAVEPLTPPDVLARLTVTVSWTEPGQRAQEYRQVELVENRTGTVGGE